MGSPTLHRPQSQDGYATSCSRFSVWRQPNSFHDSASLGAVKTLPRTLKRHAYDPRSLRRGGFNSKGPVQAVQAGYRLAGPHPWPRGARSLTAYHCMKKAGTENRISDTLLVLARRRPLVQDHFSLLPSSITPQLSPPLDQDPPPLSQDHHPLFLFEVGGPAFQ